MLGGDERERWWGWGWCGSWAGNEATPRVSITMACICHLFQPATTTLQRGNELNWSQHYCLSNTSTGKVRCDAAQQSSEPKDDFALSETRLDVNTAVMMTLTAFSTVRRLSAWRLERSLQRTLQRMGHSALGICAGLTNGRYINFDIGNRSQHRRTHSSCALPWMYKNLIFSYCRSSNYEWRL